MKALVAAGSTAGRGSGDRVQPFPLTLVRERMNARFKASAGYPITVVQAPAGFGKTTAIRHFLDSSTDAIYIQTPDSCSLRQFVREFARCCSLRYPDMAKSMPDDTPSEDDDADDAIGIYLAWALAHLQSDSERGLVVVDDIQHSHDHPAVSAFIVRLADETKGSVSWILSTRTRGMLPVTRWQAYGCADAPITAEDLRLTFSEASELAASIGSPATEEQLAQWLAQTNGFAVPLAFAIRLSAHRDNIDEILDGTRKLTFAFLAEQLWTSLSPEDRRLLEIVAVLPQIHVHYVEHAGVRDASTNLARLCSEIAFLSISPDGIFAMHDLFRDFVKDQTLLAGSQTLRERRKAGIDILKEAGRKEDAVRLLLASNDVSTLSAMIEQSEEFVSDAELVRQIVDAFSCMDLCDLGPQSLCLHTKYWNWVGDTKQTQVFAQELLSRKSVNSAQLLVALYSTCTVIDQQTEVEWLKWLDVVAQNYELLNSRDRVVVDAYRARVLSRIRSARSEASALVDSVNGRLMDLRPVERISAESALSNAAFWLGDLSLAKYFAREAVNSANAIGDLREMARALGCLGILLSNCYDSDVEALFYPLREAVERSGSWKFSQVSHWIPALYYLQMGDNVAAARVRGLQFEVHPLGEQQRRLIGIIRRHTANLAALLSKNYEAVIADYLKNLSSFQKDTSYELAIEAACAYSLNGQRDESERILKQLSRSGLNYNENLDCAFLEIFCLSNNERRIQARRLLGQVKGSAPPLVAIEAALAIFCDGPPFSGLASALEPCLGKPFIGLVALLMKRVADQYVPQTIKLTSAESDVLRLLSLGKSNKAIAEDRSRSAETVKRQVAAIYRKLGVENRTSALAIARERGLI